MNYIILDLEWNQCPQGKGKENSQIPFEIVEIGAVKLDSNRLYMDEYHQYVSPVVYRELHRVTREIIKVTMDELDTGVDFAAAARDFLEWCGADGEYVFGTWGSMDLTEFQRNCRYFGYSCNLPKPLMYYDIQKLYSICLDDGKSRASLETAVEELKLEQNISFHSAVHDALYTARIFEQLDFDSVSEYSSIDTYVIPDNRKEEFTINYGTYSKFISHGFADREELLKDPVVMQTRCYRCGRNARKKIRWFSNNQKMYYCVAWCENDGYLKGKLKIRKTDDELFYGIKILKLVDEEGARKIKSKQTAARDKRRERRRKERIKEKLRS